MPVLPTALEPRSEAFRANAAAMRALVDDLHEKSAATALGRRPGLAPEARELRQTAHRGHAK